MSSSQKEPVSVFSKSTEKTISPLKNSKTCHEKAKITPKSTNNEVIHALWKSNKFQHLIFNPDTSCIIFYSHLIRTYERLRLRKTIKRAPEVDEIRKKALNLRNIGKSPFCII